ncbi:MAG: transketolase [Anaerolineaceae bacterium]|nr:transketolase [Anaerolineaceae bacterium]
MSDDLQTLAINSIRTLAMDAVQRANSGHPGLPMGAAPMAWALWTKVLRHNPRNPHWPNRDRFVLSAGHGSMLLYALLHLTGYDLPLEELMNFRQWGSHTPGHPEYGDTAGVETTTGPLGQGAANAVGMALAEAFLAGHFNRPGQDIVDHRTFALVSDGDLQEGVCMEACALAGLWGLGKLTFLYDSNDIQLDGPTDMVWREDVPARFQAIGWHTLGVEDGNDPAQVSAALAEAQQVTDRPTLISVHTTIGYGSPNKAGSSDAHGSPLGPDEVRLTKQALGWPDEDFYIPGEALEHFREAIPRGAQQESEWRSLFRAWAAEHPAAAAEWEQLQRGELPPGWDADLPHYTDGKMATRNANGEALNAIAQHVPTMIGGDADLAGSTKTLISGAASSGADVATARNLRFGAREHAMGAIVNGLALHGGITKPYSATFLTFSDYMRAAMRLGALMGVPALYIFTHDSIGLGEDGPTHQPIEHFAALRAIPNLTVLRPADANETVAAWAVAMEQPGPCVLIFTRQDLPVIEQDAAQLRADVGRGGYVLEDCEGTPEVILLATGSEVHIARDAWRTLRDEGVGARLVSMPCHELFAAQDADYREGVLPSSVTARVSVEAGVAQGWYRWIGSGGAAVSLERFGASAPFEEVYEHLGITADAVVAAAKGLLARD